MIKVIDDNFGMEEIMEFRINPNVAVQIAAFTDAVDFYTKVIGFADRSDDPELADPGANPLNIFNMLK